MRDAIRFLLYLLCIYQLELQAGLLIKKYTKKFYLIHFNFLSDIRPLRYEAGRSLPHGSFANSDHPNRNHHEAKVSLVLLDAG